jgi:hypothetical protein
MAGGTAVVCGHGTTRIENTLGYRPCVGMVSGRIFFRGPHRGYSEQDARLTAPDDEDWQWLLDNLLTFLMPIGRTELYPVLISDRSEWHLLAARKPFERAGTPVRTMAQFVRDSWDRELGTGGLIGDLTDIPRTAIDVIPTGDLRRWVPRWENEKHLPPCQAACRRASRAEAMVPDPEGPDGGGGGSGTDLQPLPGHRLRIPVPQPLHTGMHEAGSLAAGLGRSPPGQGFPGGEDARSRPRDREERRRHRRRPGRSLRGLAAHDDGPFARRLRAGEAAGGKITATIPRARIPDDVVAREIERVRERIPVTHLKKTLTKEAFRAIKGKHDIVVIAPGAQKPRKIPVPGKDGP